VRLAKEWRKKHGTLVRDQKPLEELSMDNSESRGMPGYVLAFSRNAGYLKVGKHMGTVKSFLYCAM
jgi:hypothetical protein